MLEVVEKLKNDMQNMPMTSALYNNWIELNLILRRHGYRGGQLTVKELAQQLKVSDNSLRVTIHRLKKEIESGEIDPPGQQNLGTTHSLNVEQAKSTVSSLKPEKEDVATVQKEPKIEAPINKSEIHQKILKMEAGDKIEAEIQGEKYELTFVKFFNEGKLASFTRNLNSITIQEKYDVEAQDFVKNLK